jgi:hypothetical protein
MAKRNNQRGRRTRARNLCHHFDGTELAASARPGLEALEAGHKPVVLGGASIGCGIALDRCRQPREPNAHRWDYVFVKRDTDSAVGIEVHHTDPNEVDVMIAKKVWAEELMAGQCPDIAVVAWLWIASPPAGEIFLLPQHPYARRLADAGIAFPRTRCTLP